jgi:hypothetical protein
LGLVNICEAREQRPAGTGVGEELRRLATRRRVRGVAANPDERPLRVTVGEDHALPVEAEAESLNGLRRPAAKLAKPSEQPRAPEKTLAPRGDVRLTGSELWAKGGIVALQLRRPPARLLGPPSGVSVEEVAKGETDGLDNPIYGTGRVSTYERPTIGALVHRERGVPIVVSRASSDPALT